MGRRILVAAAVVGLGAIVTGAYLTSVAVSLEAGQSEPNPNLHRVMALVGIALVSAAWLAGARSPARRLGLVAALIALIASAGIGWNYPLQPAIAVAHAALAHIFTAAIALALLVDEPKPKEMIALG